MRNATKLAVAMTLAAGILPTTGTATEGTVIQDNMDVGLEYTLTVDGAVVDSADANAPFHYLHGKGQIIPGLERQLAGLKVGDQREVTVKPEDGYGVVNPEAIVEVSLSQLPKETPPAPGMVLRGQNADGRSFRAVVKEVKGDLVVLDLNHPLAGKTLVFNVKVLTIAPAAT